MHRCACLAWPRCDAAFALLHPTSHASPFRAAHVLNDPHRLDADAGDALQEADDLLLVVREAVAENLRRESGLSRRAD
jgi:hypothetical protein